jgi:type II secretory pathway component PulM
MSPFAARMAGIWDRASPRERALLSVGAAFVVLALFYGLAWPALSRDIARLRDDVARDRATLAYLQARAAPTRSDASPGAPVVDARATVERVLAAHGLATQAQVEAREGRIGVVLAAVPFDALVRALDDLARSSGVRVLDARITARVEPGSVRAELALGR